MNRYLLSFTSESAMRAAIGPLPSSPYGTVIARGGLGTPGVYEDTGTVSEGGETIWREVSPPNPWPGYHAELITGGPLPEELALYASPHGTWPWLGHGSPEASCAPIVCRARPPPRDCPRPRA